MKEAFTLAKFINRVLYMAHIKRVPIFLMMRSEFEDIGRMVNMVKGQEIV